MSDNPKSLVHEHIERCLECYAQPIDDDHNNPVERSTYEQVRADLLLAIGMLSVLADPKRSTP